MQVDLPQKEWGEIDPSQATPMMILVTYDLADKFPVPKICPTLSSATGE